jgi:two-component system chemotaxis response regulator CheY
MDGLYKDMSILVIDDYKLARTTLISALSHLGLNEIVEASSGEEGLEILTQRKNSGHPITMVFSDWNMPNMSGLELLKELRKNDDFKKLPFIMVTVETEVSSVEKAIEAGAQDYLVKPYLLPSIEQKITAVLKKISA